MWLATRARTSSVSLPAVRPEIALQQTHEIPHRTDQPETRRWYAWLLLDRDQPADKEKAQTLLNEAIEMYKEIGMPKHVELAEDLLSR